jgi:hypothetical protein
MAKDLMPIKSGQTRHDLGATLQMCHGKRECEARGAAS